MSDDMSGDIKQLIAEHVKADADNFGEIRTELRLIRENHLQHIQIATQKNTTDLEWLKKAFWVVAGASVSSFIAAIVNMLISYSK